MREITALSAPSRGEITTGTQALLAGGTPSIIARSNPIGSDGFTASWYCHEGIIAAPTNSNTTGWTLVPSAITNTLAAPALVNSRTYASFVVPGGNPTCGTAGWSTGAAQITVTSTVLLGRTAALNQVDGQVFCNTSGDGSLITFSTAPSGAPGLSYQWYSQQAIVAAPTGNSTAGWTAEPGAKGDKFDPPASRTYVCFVIPSQGTAGWATGRRVVQVLVPLAPAVIASGNQTAISPVNPANIILTPQAAGSSFFTYQWYSQNAIVAAPTGTSTAGWTAIAGATQTNYDPPTGLGFSRSYACFYTPSGAPMCGTSGWATGVRQITITAP